MAETSTLTNAELESTSEVVVNLIPLMVKITSKHIKSTMIAANDEHTMIKKVFNIFLSLDLNPIMIEKSMIEINIKNSTITSVTKPISVPTTEISPVMMVDNTSFIAGMKFGPAYIIKIEAIIDANPATISMIAVKYFELIS